MAALQGGGRAQQLASRLRQPWRIRAEGLEKLPDGAVIVACNRLGPLDHAFVTSSLGRAAVALVEPQAGLAAVPGVPRTTWSAEPDAPDGPAAVLARGEVLVVFPEGPAARDALVHKGHPEVAGLALSAGVSVVPAALVSAPALMRPASGTPPLAELSAGHLLRLGEPIAVARRTDVAALSDNLDGYILRGMTDTIMSAIAHLAGLGYRDEYTTRAGARGSAPTGLLGLAQLRRDWIAHRRTQAEQRAAEAELARKLDEQDRAVLDEAAEAARLQAEQAALADARARAQRRGGFQDTPVYPEDS